MFLKIWKLLFFCLAFIVHRSLSTEMNSRLNDENYVRMPHKFHLDRYTHCLKQPGGVYCTANAVIVSDEPSELLDIILEYTANNVTHYNHTELRYGLCMTRTCLEFLNGTGAPALQAAAEACLNDTLTRGYGLKTRVTEVNCYFEDKTMNKYTVDWLDWVAAAIVIIILALNVIGSAYDFRRSQTEPGNRFLLAFSCRLNWNQLTEPPKADPRALELQSLNGIRFLTCLAVMLVHVPGPAYIALENLDFMETVYNSSHFYILLSGNMVTQSFFLMSGFLLVYNMQMSLEKQPFTLKKYFKNIFLRIMRLAPLAYFSVLLTATWQRLMDYGPLWQEQAGIEVDHCRKYWIYNVLFINNYISVSSCNLQAWSTATDLHLHIIGLTVILLAPTAAWRRAALALLMLAALLWPAHTVLALDLDGNIIQSPQALLETNMNSPTFHYLYKPTHNNMTVFLIGMIFGYIVYDRQQRKVTSEDYTRYRFAYWLLLPALGMLLSLGAIFFYHDGPRVPVLFRALFASLVKPLIGLTVMLIIFGAIHKVETLYRGVLEWRGFVPLAKLSYSTYSFHMLLVRFVGGTRSTLVHYSFLHGMHDYCGLVAMSLVMALVMHLALEAPVSHLVKIAFAQTPAQPALAAKERKTQ